MKHIFLSLLLVSISLFAFPQVKPAYVLYDKQGKKVSYKKMIRVLKEKDIVLFGELHNDPIAHWLELALAKELYAYRPLVLGAEMFETDNQEALDMYLRGSITAQGLDSMTRLWKNYTTDYAPLVNFAKEKKLVFAATNIPRRYAALVARGGFEAVDSLPADEKQWIAPLPILYDSTLPGYRNMLTMMPGHGGPNLPKAQAIKDATMANSLLRYFTPGSLFIHYHGSYHSENNEGICWYIRQQRPELKYATIATVSQTDIQKLEEKNKGKADFIICVDADMTHTY